MSDITIREAWEIEIMREAGRIVAGVLKLAAELAKPGVSTAALDRAAEEYIRGHSAKPTFKGYRGFPATLCTSINQEIVHGIPSPKRILQDGDLLKIDAGVTYKQYIGDAAVSVPIGPVTEQIRRLVEDTRGSLEAAIRVAGPTHRLLEIGKTIQHYAESRGYSVVKKWGGHGVGQKLHEDPHVPNYYDPGLMQEDMKLKPGLVIAIEPMLNLGTDETKTQSDKWTVVTADGKISAHFEHTVAITKDGPVILTLP